jgi:hypothetical protein
LKFGERGIYSALTGPKEEDKPAQAGFFFSAGRESLKPL